MTDAYAEVARAYDSFASEYDEWVGEHVSARRAKAALLLRVRALTQRGDHLLDVGCGTGSEALALARAGRHVVGVDVSARMLEVARAKLAARGGAPGSVRLLQGAAGEAAEAWLPSGIRSFDLAYSAYGVLNLEPDPAAALARLARLVKPGGHVVVGTLNPTVLYELLAYPLALRWKGYRKALGGSIRLRLGHGRAESATCILPTNARWATYGRRAGLDPVEEAGLHVLLPPPSEGMIRRIPRVVAWANRAEARLESRRPFCRLGYFSLLVMRRRDIP